LNFLSNTAYEELIAIRKAYKHMHLPGCLHFQALLHLLHHLRCYSLQAFLPRCSKRPGTLLLIQASSGFAIHHLAIVMIPVQLVAMLVSFKVD
jgi:hypothetical protein